MDMPATTTGPDPNKIKVQLNVEVSWALNERLDAIAARTGSTKAFLVRRALLAAYPADVTPEDQDSGDE